MDDDPSLDGAVRLAAISRHHHLPPFVCKSHASGSMPLAFLNTEKPPRTRLFLAAGEDEKNRETLQRTLTVGFGSSGYISTPPWQLQ